MPNTIYFICLLPSILISPVFIAVTCTMFKNTLTGIDIMPYFE